MSAKPATPEFPYPLAIEKISASGTVRALEANAEERQRLAERFGLLELKSLKAELEVHLADPGQAYTVTGRLTADVVQKCVVTLEPLPAHIESKIDTVYMAEAPKEEPQAQIDPDEVEIETVVNGVIDLGELVAQSLGVALDPYPRKPGVDFTGPAPDDKIVTGPFARLAELKKKDK